MKVWVVTIGGRLNAVFADQEATEAHVKRLIEVNGDQIAVRWQEVEVRS